MAIPKPKPSDWQRANARELQITDKEVLAMLRATSRTVKAELDALIAKDSPLISAGVKRAQLENVRASLLAEQSKVFERLGDIVSARRASSASRAARLSAAGNDALLRLAGAGQESQFLYDSALKVGQRAIDAALARMRLSELPLSQRVYRTGVWMNGRLSKLINQTLASGLDAREFAKKARDWFNPSTPGGVRFAAMRLARTEINNAFHAISAEKYATTPWINKVEWNLSKAHPKPDECNVLANASPFESADVPARPHPQCMCYITPVSVDEDEFIDNFLAGDYDDYLDSELDKAGFKEPGPKKVATPNPAVTLPKLKFSDRVESSAKRHDALAAPLFGLERRPRPQGFTPEMAQAVNRYTGNYYKQINNALRGTGKRDEKVDGWIRDLDAAMDASKLQKESLLYRGISDASKLFGDFLKGDMTGMEWKEDAYVSTTALESLAESFMTGTKPKVRMRILAPKGMGAIEASPAEAEGEVLLQRDIKMRVVKDYGIGADGIRRIDVEAVGAREEFRSES